MPRSKTETNAKMSRNFATSDYCSRNGNWPRVMCPSSARTCHCRM
jgi:hypothetical protein